MQAPREWGPKAHRSVLRSCARGINSGRAESRRPLAPREMHVDFEVGVVDEVAGVEEARRLCVPKAGAGG